MQEGLNKGTGFRRGLCPSTCSKVFKECKDAFFQSDESASAAKITVCRKDSLLCSKLSDMASDETQACQLLGWDVTAKLEVEEHLRDRLAIRDELRAAELEGEYTCHDLEASGKRYGRARYRVISKMGAVLRVAVVLFIMSLY